MPSNHETNQACPICTVTLLSHTHCRNVSCTFVVTACSRCDRAQDVAAFVADHEKDCIHGSQIQTIVKSTFVAPRRAA